MCSAAYTRRYQPSNGVMLFFFDMICQTVHLRGGITTEKEYYVALNEFLGDRILCHSLNIMSHETNF